MVESAVKGFGGEVDCSFWITPGDKLLGALPQSLQSPLLIGGTSVVIEEPSSQPVLTHLGAERLCLVYNPCTMWDASDAYAVQEASRELNHFTDGDEARILMIESKSKWDESHSYNGM